MPSDVGGLRELSSRGLNASILGDRKECSCDALSKSQRISRTARSLSTLPSDAVVVNLFVGHYHSDFFDFGGFCKGLGSSVVPRWGEDGAH